MKKCPFHQGRFLAAAYEEEQFPSLLTSRQEFMPEIAIVGRSNVGKSSLINSLIKGQKLAKASSTPGKTQSINFFDIDQQLVLVDLPGYGYAKVSKKIKEKWSMLIETYLHTRKSLRLILFLMDSRRHPSEEDIAFLQWASHRRISLLCVFTKVDKIKPLEREEHAAQCLKHFQSLGLYRNYLKNREFDKEAPQNFHLERATIVQAQGASEDENFEEKPTPSKTDFSSSFGICSNSLRFLYYSIKDPRARIELIQQINGFFT